MTFSGTFSSNARLIILSSTSVKLETSFTLKPTYSKKRRKVSKTTTGRMLPTWASPYTVGPQQYIETSPGLIGLNVSTLLDNELNKRISIVY